MKKMLSLALFLLSLVVLCVATACNSGESVNLDGQDAGGANADHLNLTMDFKLNAGQTSFAPMYVYGRYFPAGKDVEAERKPVKCQTSQVLDATRLTCDLGTFPVSQEVRFMVQVPQADGTVVPACKTLDSCIGQVLVYSPDQPNFHADATNMTLVQDSLFSGGIAFKFYIPMSHL